MLHDEVVSFPILAAMDYKVLFVLILFSMLFLGGGALTVNGLLTGKKRQLWWGLALLLLSFIMTIAGLGD